MISPYDADERLLVSASLLSFDSFDYVRPALVADDFTDRELRTIWTALLRGMDYWAIQQRLPHMAQKVVTLMGTCPGKAHDRGLLASMALEVARAADARRRLAAARHDDRAGDAERERMAAIEWPFK